MRKHHILIVGLVTAVLVAAILFAAETMTDLTKKEAGYTYLGILIVSALFLFGLWYWRNAYLLVNEMDAAVIFYKSSNNFAYFIDSKPDTPVAPGRPYNLHKTRLLNRLFLKNDPYHHFINPFKERLEVRVTKRPLSVRGVTDNFRTKEGVPVKVSWSVSYNLDVTLIRPGIEYKLARAIPYFHTNMIQGRAVQSLRYMIEQKEVTELYTTDAIKKLEVELRHEVTKRVQGLGFKDISQVDISVGPIQVPYDVQKAIEAAHERELQTTTAVKALEQLRVVVSRFTDSDMERLSDLERLRILDEHGGSLSYEMASLRKSVEKNKTKRIIKDNGHNDSGTPGTSPP